MKLRRRVRTLLVVSAVAVGGVAAIPPAEAHANFCDNTTTCMSNYMPNFGGGAMDIYFDGWQNGYYTIKVWVNGTEYTGCRYDEHGFDPPSRHTCYGLPPGQAYASSFLPNFVGDHDISVTPG